MPEQPGAENADEANEPMSVIDRFGAMLEAEDNPPPPEEEETPQNQDAPPDESDTEGEEPSSDEEDTPDESDVEDTEETDEEGTEEEEPTPEGDPVFVVETAYDGEQELTLTELGQGYLRQEDYSRKTAELATQRTDFIETQSAVRQERADLVKKLEQVEVFLETNLVEPDWEKLKRENPAEYNRLKLAHTEAKDRFEAVQGERKANEDKTRQEIEKEYSRYVEHQRGELLKVFPKWKNEGVLKESFGELEKEANRRGFTTEEFNAIDNHALLVLLHDGMKYQQLQGTKSVVRKKAGRAPTIRPGATKQPKRKPTKAHRARVRLKETGSVTDAANVFLAGIESDLKGD